MSARAILVLTKTTNISSFDFNIGSSMMFPWCPSNKVSLSGFTMTSRMISAEDDPNVTIIDSDNSSRAEEP